MTKSEHHTFHIPVMGLAYTIDTPLKVARFGISSVVSIIEDILVEQMRKFYCEQEEEEYIAIPHEDIDHRAKRITAYLNLLNKIVAKQTKRLKAEAFVEGNEIVKYFEMLPDDSSLKLLYLEMTKMEEGAAKELVQQKLREKIVAGSIDVNIMTKCDRMNFAKDGTLLPVEYADAMAALRGFALSDLSSSVVFSAGLNPRLYTYCESFKDFFPDENGNLKKKIILKVSDYRSALIQGKFFAKKGLWISEFRVESGLNCGGHAFATDGILLGPILEEFKNKKPEIVEELFSMCNNALIVKGHESFVQLPKLKITVQGGIGTANENKFLMEYYEVDGTGWGSPFLLVPEVTNVDNETLNQLSVAKKEDYYLSYASPLGIPFNNFRKSSAEKQRIERIEKGRPGSACYKTFLAFNTEFSNKPICGSSREYQHLKIKQLKEKNLSPAEYQKEFDAIVVKDCLCEGLAAPVLVKNNIPVPHNLTATSICPGPNLAYFSGIHSLREMVEHIYGRTNILNSVPRPYMFVNELVLYAEYLKKEIEKSFDTFSEKQSRYLQNFKSNLLEGIDYYKNLIPSIKLETERKISAMKEELTNIELALKNLVIPEMAAVHK
ncbi:MAG: hypothetical protein A3F72_16945 [Bacteroidetes bacterium RIFCSPLOWO2_12_FULL_35_15]|nr:MAG: hypothetical protein A3F72_16945 [Bacteroidetes bacterium RIFCSPLOWO2_12_FULL_35_15]